MSNSITLTKRSGNVLTCLTMGKRCDSNIIFNIDAVSATPVFDGGELTSKSATANFINATTSSTNTSGISVTPKGSSGRDDVLYNGAVNGWVNQNDNAVAIASTNPVEWSGSTVYITGVTLTAGKTFDITVPNGENTLTFHFTVDVDGNTTIT